jgi:predicted nucleic acid-binding protein
MNILIDTDVILDFFFDRDPYSDPAAEVLSLCESGRIKGFVTPVICSNIYYLLRRSAKHEKVIEKINQLMRILDVLSMDREVVIQALSSGFRDFEDSLQNAAAINSGMIGIIVTGNVKDYSKSEMGVMTPENFLKIIE